MGCRESKLDVVTGNTVQNKKPKRATAPPEALPVDKSGGGLVQTPVTDVAKARGDGDGHGGTTLTTDGKDGGSGELDGKIGRGSGEEEEEDAERSISRDSPNHYFSSRKDDESIDANSADERSVYSSPPHEAAVKETTEVDAVEETRAGAEKIDGDCAGRESTDVKDEKLMIEPETAEPQTEGKNSGEEKTANTAADEENISPSLSRDDDQKNTNRDSH